MRRILFFQKPNNLKIEILDFLKENDYKTFQEVLFRCCDINDISPAERSNAEGNSWILPMFVKIFDLFEFYEDDYPQSFLNQCILSVEFPEESVSLLFEIINTNKKQELDLRIEALGVYVESKIWDDWIVVLKDKEKEDGNIGPG